MKNNKAYGCYGCVTTFDSASDACGACPLKVSCEKEAYRALKQMSAEVEVTHLLGRFSKLAENDAEPVRPGVKKQTSRRQKLKQYTPGGHTLMLMTQLPKKGRQVVSQLAKKGLALRPLLAGKNNPFYQHRPTFMRTPCRLLIEKGQFTRPELKAAMLEEFPNWQESSAESHASVAIKVLVISGVIERHTNRYVLKG